MKHTKPTTFAVELHQHLGGSSAPRFLWELAHEQGIRLAEKDYWNFISNVTISEKTSQQNYHDLYDLIQLIQSSPYGVERSVHHAISSAYRTGGIDLLEIRFNPMRRNRGGEHDLDKIILAALTGMKKACLEYPVKAGLIIELDRRFDPVKNKILTDKAVHYKDEGVIGLDLSGPSSPTFKVSDFTDHFQRAKKAGLGLTFHTGEFTSASEVWEVVRSIEPHRLGHGIKAVEDEKLLEFLRDHRIVLEVCPTSNIMTQVVSGWVEVSQIIRKLIEFHIRFAVCADSPEFFGINPQTELTKLVDIQALTLDQADKVRQTARNSSFLNPDFIASRNRKEPYAQDYYY